MIILLPPPPPHFQVKKCTTPAECEAEIARIDRRIKFLDQQIKTIDEFFKVVNTLFIWIVIGTVLMTITLLIRIML
jgi:hypothetical protein